MKKLMLVLTASAVIGSAVGCTAQQTRPAAKPAKATSGEVDGGLATRISRICALPSSQRDAEIAKLKKESGLVLYCGQEDKR